MKPKIKAESINNPLHYFRRMMKNETYRECEKTNARHKIEIPLSAHEHEIAGTINDELEYSISECTERGDLSWLELIEDKALYDTLKAFPIEDQRLLILYVKDGLYQSEIAKIMGCTQPNIAYRISKIRKKLKHFF